MTSTDESTRIPSWGVPFVENLRGHLARFSDQAAESSIISQALYRTFALAQAQLEELPEEQRNERIQEEWLFRLAEEAFVRQLFHWLSIAPELYFEVLYSTFQLRIRHHIMMLLQKPEKDADVEDCLQDTFMKIYNSLVSKARQGKEIAPPFTGWLNAVASSVCKDHWAKQKEKQATDSLEEQTMLLEKVQDDEYQQPDMYLELKEREEKVRQCVEQLPEPCRDCIRLFYFEAHSLPQIARKLQISESRVRSCIYQLAERRLRKLWRREYDG